MKKGIIIAAIILVLAVIGFYFYSHNEAKAPTSENSEYQAQPTSTNPSSSDVNCSAKNGFTYGELFITSQ